MHQKVRLYSICEDWVFQGCRERQGRGIFCTFLWKNSYKFCLIELSSKLCSISNTLCCQYINYGILCKFCLIEHSSKLCSMSNTICHWYISYGVLSWLVVNVFNAGKHSTCKPKNWLVIVTLLVKQSSVHTTCIVQLSAKTGSCLGDTPRISNSVLIKMFSWWFFANNKVHVHNVEIWRQCRM